MVTRTHFTRPAEGHPLVVMPTWYDRDGNHVYPRSLKTPLDGIPREEWPSFWPTYPAIEALDAEWPSERATRDAHTTQYTVLGEASFPRLPKRYPEALDWLASRGGEVWMVALFLDQDLPGHRKAETFSPRELREWWAPKLEGLRSTPLGRKAGWYRTAGGVRYVWLLDPWVSPRIWPAVFGRVRDGMSRVLCTAEGDRVDDTKDWTRLMRLPRVTRQGVDLRFRTDFSSMVPVDMLDELGASDAALLEDSARREAPSSQKPATPRMGRPPVRTAQNEADAACIRTALREADGLVEAVRRHKVRSDRNGYLYWAAVRLGEVAEWIDAEAAVGRLAQAAVDAGLQGGEREAWATARSGVELGLRNPRDLRREYTEQVVLMNALTQRGGA